PIDPVDVDLVEHRLLVQPEGVVAVAVELLGRQAAKVADTGQRNGEQPVQELPHPVVAQGDLGADRHALAQLELRDGLGRLTNDRLLTGDGRQIADRALDQLRVPGRLADAHVDDNLDHARDLHDVAEAELLLERGANLVVVAGLQPRRDGRFLLCRMFNSRCAHYRSLPVRRATRTLRPCESTRLPPLVGLLSPSTTCTFEMWIDASWVTMPPVF